MTTKIFLLLFWILIISKDSNAEFTEKPRTCCKYSNKTECPDTRSCTLASSIANNIHPSNLEQCVVQLDSKKDKLQSQCSTESYKSQNEDNLNLLNLIQVRGYIFDTDKLGNKAHIYGLELRIPYWEPWKLARFKWSNEQCNNDCTPRCVEIARNGELSAKNTQENLVYDCELGFYHPGQSTIPKGTSGSTYSLNMCLDETCKSYFLRIPKMSDPSYDSDLIPLIEMEALLQGELVVHLSSDWSNKNVTLNITSLKANEKDENSSSNNPPLIIKESITQSGILRRFIGMQLESNTHYSISLLVKNEKWLEIGQFQTGEKNRTAISVVFTCLFLLFLVILGFFVYKRYKQIQEKHQVNPNRLLESGRIQPRNVLIISNVDNRHHIDVVLAFNRYLKTHCAVGEIYFALDPNTGITSEGNHDPWKWAQETMEKISRENGFIIYIAGPPSQMGLEIYKNLPNNQTFVGEEYLQSMAEENRIAVVHFPYSDSETIPTILPIHIRNDPSKLPEDFNALLCQLLEVRKRELFSFIPIPIVRPKILPHEFSHFKGGPEILTKIDTLTSRVNEFKAEQLRQQKNQTSTLPRTEDSLIPPPSASETKFLLKSRPTKNGGKIQNNGNSSIIRNNENSREIQIPSEESLKVNLEAGVLSLNDSEFNNRDKSVNPDLV